VVIARRMCLVITAFSLLLKLGLFFVCTRRHARGRRVFRHIWHQLRYFAPACIPPKPRLLGLEVEGRLVALTWIHGTCGLVLLFIAAAVAVNFSNLSGFSSEAAGLPLTGLFFIKSVTIGIAFASTFHQMKVKKCAGRLGCLFFQDPPRLSRHQRSSSRSERLFSPALPLTPETLRNVTIAKALDAAVSIFMWIALVEQKSLGSYPLVTVVILYRLALAVSLVCDVLGVVLAMVAAWLLGTYLADHDPDQEHDDEYSSDSEDYESDSGSSGSDDESDDDDDSDASDDSDSDEYTDDDRSDDGRRSRGSRSRSRSSRRSARKKKSKKKKGRDADDPRTPLSEYESDDEDDDDDDDDDDEDDDFIFTVGGNNFGGGDGRKSSKKRGKGSRKKGKKRKDGSSPSSATKPRVTVPSINFSASPRLSGPAGGGGVSASLRWADPNYAQAQQWEQQQRAYEQQQQMQMQMQMQQGVGASSEGYWTVDGQWYDPANPDAYYVSQQQQQQQQQQQHEADLYAQAAASQPLATARDHVRHVVDARKAAAAFGLGGGGVMGSTTTSSSSSSSSAAPLTARDAVRHSASALATARGAAAASAADYGGGGGGGGGGSAAPLTARDAVRHTAAAYGGRDFGGGDYGGGSAAPLTARDAVRHSAAAVAAAAATSSPRAAPSNKTAAAPAGGAAGGGGGDVAAAAAAAAAAFGMNPVEFQEKWESISGKGVRNLTTEVETLGGAALSAEAVATHLTSRGFLVVASGVTEEEAGAGEGKEGEEEKAGGSGVSSPLRRSRRGRRSLLKVYACRKSQPSQDKGAATFLLEMIFINEKSDGAEEKGEEKGEDVKTSTLKLTFKCDDPSQLASFVQRLNLNRLCKGQGVTEGKKTTIRKSDV
jgi:hypothetical protein